jgi:Putative Na+/H+ antiporter
MRIQLGLFLAVPFLILLPFSVLSAGPGVPTAPFPPSLEFYQTAADAPLLSVLRDRIYREPFNLVASIIFLLAIVHTFLAPFFLRLAHKVEENHLRKLKMNDTASDVQVEGRKPEVSVGAEILHFLGEIEAIFGIWVIPLLLALFWAKGRATVKEYINDSVDFTEPMFVVVIMAIAASRPVLKLADHLLSGLARLGKGSPAAWWFSILTVGPILGSFITEPAAMTISALLLAQKFYERKPSPPFAYATLGLLFVNISVGGTLTHFAAPPVLMVASKWGWGLSYMLIHFGWKTLVGIVLANGAYLFWFRKELKLIGAPCPPLDVELIHERTGQASAPVPFWITLIHLLFLAWTVLNNYSPVLFIGGFLFYLAFTQATQHHQFDLQLRSPLLVGFFLAGLVIHGGLQAWWIEPVLTRLSEKSLFFSAIGLTAFNDNAAITYLASLVPDFGPQLKNSIVAGAVIGGGLTVIANAPNPAGQSILSQYFPDGVSPLFLFLGALLPTLIMAACFLLLS